MKVTLGKLHGTLDLVFLSKGKVVGSETFTGKTDTPYTRQVVVTEKPDQIVLDVDVLQHGLSLEQIQSGFKRWAEYYKDGGACIDSDVNEAPDEYAEHATQTLIRFIKGE